MKVVKSKNYKTVAKGLTDSLNEVLSIHTNRKGEPEYMVKAKNDYGTGSLQLVVWSPKCGTMPICVVNEVAEVVEEYAKVYGRKVWATMGTVLRVVSLGDMDCDVWSPCVDIYLEFNGEW